MADRDILPHFQDTGLHIYSQTDEDGFLLYIYSLIGATNKKVIEIGSGDGIECNSANLIINHGWNGLFVDGDEISINTAKKIYGFLKTTKKNPPKLVNIWITTDSINQLIKDNNFDGEIDLLSIDIDGKSIGSGKQLNVLIPELS